ncbi:MAG: ribokinase [Nocardioidaceae bacterium]
MSSDRPTAVPAGGSDRPTAATAGRAAARPGRRPAAVVVVGSVNRDYVCRVATVPRPGETLLGADLSLGSGGKGGNQAVAAALLGAPTSIVARVGDDADGRALLADLETAGVDVSGVSTSPDAPTGVAFVMVADDGENAIVVAPGANGELDAGAVTAALKGRLAAGDVLVMQGEIPLSGIEAAADKAERLGARVVLNLAPYRELPEALLGLCDPLVVNEGEALALLDIAAEDVVDSADLAIRVGGWARSAVVTLGAAGAVVAEGYDTEEIPAGPMTVVDTTGAGDAFTGALAAALCDGADLATAARRGAAAGSYAVGRAGAQASCPRREDLPASS